MCLGIWFFKNIHDNKHDNQLSKMIPDMTLVGLWWWAGRVFIWFLSYSNDHVYIWKIMTYGLFILEQGV